MIWWDLYNLLYLKYPRKQRQVYSPHKNETLTREGRPTHGGLCCPGGDLLHGKPKAVDLHRTSVTAGAFSTLLLEEPVLKNTLFPNQLLGSPSLGCLTYKTGFALTCSSPPTSGGAVARGW